MRVVTFKLDKELLQQLDLYCVNHKLTRSEAIREAIELYLGYKSKGRVYRKKSVKENKNNRVRVRRT